MHMPAEPKARILVDYDGTMARVNDFACVVMTALGFPRTARDLTTYDSVRETPAAERAFWTAYDILDAAPHVRASLQPYDDGTVRALEDLVLAGDFVQIVTANEASAGEGIAAWLDARSPLLYQNLPIRCLGRHAPSKATLGYDIIIDDSPRLADECPTVKRFRAWTEVPGLVARAKRAINAGAAQRPILLLANARWNGAVQDRGEF